MDELTAKLRARDRAEWREGVRELRWAAIRARFLGSSSESYRRHTIASLVFAAQALHARRGTLNLPSTQRAIARYVF